VPGDLAQTRHLERFVSTRLSDNTRNESDPELPQMMVKVFVHEDGPLLRLKRAKKWMWVPGAARRALAYEIVYYSVEPGAFALNITFSGVHRPKFW